MVANIDSGCIQNKMAPATLAYVVTTMLLCRSEKTNTGSCRNAKYASSNDSLLLRLGLYTLLVLSKLRVRVPSLLIMPSSSGFKHNVFYFNCFPASAASSMSISSTTPHTLCKHFEKLKAAAMQFFAVISSCLTGSATPHPLRMPAPPSLRPFDKPDPIPTLSIYPETSAQPSKHERPSEEGNGRQEVGCQEGAVHIHPEYNCRAVLEEVKEAARG